MSYSLVYEVLRMLLLELFNIHIYSIYQKIIAEIHFQKSTKILRILIVRQKYSMSDVGPSHYIMSLMFVTVFFSISCLYQLLLLILQMSEL